jgi:hypothetical protein
VDAHTRSAAQRPELLLELVSELSEALLSGLQQMVRMKLSSREQLLEESLAPLLAEPSDMKAGIAKAALIPTNNQREYDVHQAV